MVRSGSGPEIQADVLIAGGGLVGGTLACGLAMGGLSVIVVDAQDPADGLDAAFDGRASAIALSSQRVLEGLGLWSSMEKASAAIKEIRVTDGDSLFFLHYDRRDVGAEAFGYMVENRVIRTALASRFTDLDNLTLLAPARIDALERNPGDVRATLADGRTIKARLVIGAEGRKSPTREQAGISITNWSYRQAGIVCTVAHEFSHDNVAHERFLPAGPFAILPLPDNRSSIVWTEREELAPELMALDDDAFLAELEERFGDFLGRLEVVGPRWAYPLSLQFAERAVDHRLVLAGDASHAMHPIAGQGLNMGLRDVAVLAEVLTDARRLGLDPGAGTVLESYERWRRFDNTLMLAMTDLLNRLFSNDVIPVRLARDLGLAAVNRMPPLKKVFMEHAMGLAGDLPRLMRGERL
ncbi:MAG: 2-octaprenyl-6-methoxyphenyl hydroxylase [Rhodospirillales bacterium]|nr:2-octaprenyl-6-methoxyphenyl hydroxylase [Rhodospirillales bacterium]